jgi:methionyl-tRNA formyltransferase
MSIAHVWDDARMIESILFFGTKCSFADHVLKSLLAHRVEIRARVVPGTNDGRCPIQHVTPPGSRPQSNRLPMVGTPTTTARPQMTQSVPTLVIRRHADSETAESLLRLNADLAIVCCYPKRLPMEVVNTARYGAINIHPSLLPQYRGPEPLFWIYRNGERKTGVTLHRVDQNLDTGPIILQQELDIPIGAPGDDLWMQSAELGAKLAIKALEDSNAPDFVERAQDASKATYYSWPDPSDLIIRPEDWETWRLFHFFSGVLPLGYGLTAACGNGVQIVTAAFDYEGSSRTAIAEQSSDHNVTALECRDGRVFVRTAPVLG